MRDVEMVVHHTVHGYCAEQSATTRCRLLTKFTPKRNRQNKAGKMRAQKFHRGDFVRVAKDLGPHMRHFTADCNAIVLGSYADQFGGDATDQYALLLEGHGACAWYYEKQLTLIDANRGDLLQDWEDKQRRDAEEKSDIDWIFANGKDVIAQGYSASLQTLATSFGLHNLWGPRGEGVDYAANAAGTLELARPYLETGDKDGWLARAAEIRARR